jgi:hypothetical protein
MEPTANTPVETTYGEIRRSQDKAFERGELAGARRSRVEILSVLTAIYKNNNSTIRDREACKRVLELLSAREEEAFSPGAIADLAKTHGEKAGATSAIIAIRSKLVALGIVKQDYSGAYWYLDGLGRLSEQAAELELPNV